jgi:hypothetical protein
MWSNRTQRMQFEMCNGADLNSTGEALAFERQAQAFKMPERMHAESESLFHNSSDGRVTRPHTSIATRPDPEHCSG